MSAFSHNRPLSKSYCIFGVGHSGCMVTNFQKGIRPEASRNLGQYFGTHQSLAHTNFGFFVAVGKSADDLFKDVRRQGLI